MKLKGFTLLETLLSIFLLSTLTLFILHLAALRGNVTRSMEEKSSSSGVAELLKSKYLDINNSLPKYQIKGTLGDKVLLTEEMVGDKKIRVFGHRENAFIIKYQILVSTTTNHIKTLEDISYSHFKVQK